MYEWYSLAQDKFIHMYTNDYYDDDDDGKKNYNFLINEEKKLFVMYICIHITIMTCHFACRSSQKYKKKIENFVLFPLSWKATKKISQCQCMYTLFTFIVKVVLYKKKRVERQKKYFFFFTRLTFAFAILFIYSCLFDILNSKRDLFCRFHERRTEKSLTL